MRRKFGGHDGSHIGPVVGKGVRLFPQGQKRLVRHMARQVVIVACMMIVGVDGRPDRVHPGTNDASAWPRAAMSRKRISRDDVAMG